MVKNGTFTQDPTEGVERMAGKVRRECDENNDENHSSESALITQVLENIAHTLYFCFFHPVAQHIKTSLYAKL